MRIDDLAAGCFGTQNKSLINRWKSCNLLQKVILILLVPFDCPYPVCTLLPSKETHYYPPTNTTVGCHHLDLAVQFIILIFPGLPF